MLLTRLNLVLGEPHCRTTVTKH